MDLPVWQELYSSLNDPNFELISVAEDSRGEAAAGSWFDRAKPTYRCVIDPTHKISTLFGWVNVPSAAWIDEAGRIVRINEGTYVGEHEIKKSIVSFQFGSTIFGDAVRDWVRKGSESEFVWSAAEVRDHLKPTSDAIALADPTFKLAVYFKRLGNEAKAETYFQTAQKLAPRNWNYHRQDWTYGGEFSAMRKWNKKSQAKGAGRYYDPMELPGESAIKRKPPQFVWTKPLQAFRRMFGR